MSKSFESVSLGNSADQCLVAAIVLKLLGEADRALGSDREAARSRIARAVALLTTNDAAASCAGGKPIRRGLAPWQIRRVTDYVEDNLDQVVRVEDLTSIIRLSPSYFSAAFRRSFGVTPHNYLINRRIERAKALMRSTDDPLSQIAAACGLYDQAHLSHLFRRLMNTSPNEWRRQNREQPATALAA